MFGAVREFQAPLGVTHAVRGYFGPTPASLYTVFARTNNLDLYVVRASAHVGRLELVQCTPLGANVATMHVLSRSSAHDLLVLGFDRMRLAILSWSHDTRRWITIQLLDHASLLGTKLCSPSSIMYSQDPRDPGKPILRGAIGLDSQPLVKADPSGRCLGVLAKNQNVLYIVPVSAEEESSSLPSRVVNDGDVFLIDLPVEYEANNIKEFVFLQGSFEPNVVILYEPKRTWAGRAAIQRNTSHILNISVDIQAKRTSKTWSMDQLPYDCSRLEAIPESAGGGILLISTSLIMQIRHGACVAALSLNCFGDAYAAEVKSKYESIKHSGVLVEADASLCRFLDVEEYPTDSSSAPTQSIALLSLKGGELYFLNISVASRNSILMKRAGSTVIASEIVPINHRFFILASRLSDSLLVEYQNTAQDTDDENEQAENQAAVKKEGKAHGTEAPAKKRKKRKRSAQDEAEYEMIYGVKPPQESSDDDSDRDDGDNQRSLDLDQKDEGTRGVYDDEDELGWVFNTESDESEKKGSSGAGNWALKVKDTLPCFGPGADLTIGRSPGDDTGSKLDMVVAGGYAKNGCLAVVHQSIRPTFSASFLVPGCRGVWALRDPLSVKQEQDALKRRNEARTERNMTRRRRNSTQLVERDMFIEEAVGRLETKTEDEAELAPGKETVRNEHNPETGVSSEKPEDQHGELNKDAASSGAIGSKPENEDNDSKPNIVSKELGEAESIHDDDSNVKPVQNGLESNGIHDHQQPTTRSVSSIEAQKETKPGSEETILPGHEKSDSKGADHVGSNEVHEPQSDGAAKKAKESDELLTSQDIEYTPPLKRQKLDALETTEQNSHHLNNMSEVIQNIHNDAEEKFPFEEEESLEQGVIEDPALHSVVLMSTDSNTLVLKSSAELEEVNPESIGFIGSEKTVAAGNIFGSYAIAQVTATKLRVLRGSRILCEFDMSSKQETIERAQISDPLILVETLNGSVYVLSVTAVPCEENEVDKEFSIPSINNEEFDEYGIEISNDKQQNGKTESPPKSTSIGNQIVSSKGYKDFSVSIDFLQEPSGNDLKNAITAYLYSGSIATEIVKDGVLLTASKHQHHDGTPQKSSIDPMEGEGTKGLRETVPVAKGEADEIHNEDRMLYGDDNEDEDKLLYGAGDEGKSRPAKENASVGKDGEQVNGNFATSDDMKKPNKGEHTNNPEKGTVPLPNEGGEASKNEHLLLIVRKNGSLVILSRELQYATILESPFFFAAPSLVSDVGDLEEGDRGSEFPPASEELKINHCAMIELPCSALLHNLSTPVLIATSRSGMPLLYRAFMASRSGLLSTSRSRLVFERIVARDRTAHLFSRSMKHTKQESPPIASFRNIGGRAGIFVGGIVPFFVFAERGYPRLHPLAQTSSSSSGFSREEVEMSVRVAAFTEFHNVTCPRGFMCIYHEGETRIGELPPINVMNYDAPAPMRKIALRCTPHKVAYHAGSATYGILASMPTLTTREERLARILQSLEKHDKRHYLNTAAQAEAETGTEKTSRVPPLFEELHELRVYRPDTWELIKSHKLEKGEVGLAISNMTVDVYKQQLSKDREIHSSKKDDDGNESPFAASLKMRPKNVLAVGTGHLNGEDAGSRGRLLLFEISRQDGYTTTGSFTSFQLQLIAEKDLPAPVTAVAAMEGYVIAGVGPQISLYKFVGDELIHLSFAFGQLYCTSIASLKHYLVAADMCKSVSFMYFRDRNNSVNFLGKDYEHLTSYATEFLIENDNMSIIVSDGRGNFQLMNYVHASNAQSRGGKRLLVNGGIHFGARVNKFVRFRAPDSKKDIESGVSAHKSGKHSLLFPTLDGGLGGLIAVTESEYRNLEKLWSYMVKDAGIRNLVGIHAVEQSAFRAERASTVLLDQRLLDSRSAFDIFSLSLVEMRLAAKKMGVELDSLIDTLLEMDSVLSRF